MKEWLLALCIGYLIDLILGDPHWLWHPVRGIGYLISSYEKVVRKRIKETKQGEMLAGIFLVIFVTMFSVIIPFGILFIANLIHPYVKFTLECIMCYQLLATKSLKVESMKVYKELKKDDLEGARKAVSMIVGRDTKNLTKEEVAKAAVETVAENTSDGIIAPMIFMACGGVLGGYFYKAINTMDSMVGYKNEKYLYFGRATAYLDDIVNFIPARISAILIIIASFILRLDYKNAFKIYKRDRYNHASPNSAQTEAACAGALGIMLAGDAYYFGKLNKKQTIGDRLREISYEDIKITNRLLYVSSALGILVIAIIWVTIFICY